jgi:transcriptional regulator with XRE-family HTH domain
MKADGSANDGPINVRAMRHAAGLSQQALAARAECSISAVALFERGYAPKRSAVLDRVLAALTGERGLGAPSESTPEPCAGGMERPTT